MGRSGLFESLLSPGEALSASLASISIFGVAVSLLRYLFGPRLVSRSRIGLRRGFFLETTGPGSGCATPSSSQIHSNLFPNPSSLFHFHLYPHRIMFKLFKKKKDGSKAGASSAAPRPQPSSLASPTTSCSSRAPPVEFGVQIDWGATTPSQYAATLGRTPACIGSFLSIGPTWDPEPMRSNIAEIETLRTSSGRVPKYLLTVMPYNGLAACTDDVFQSLASSCREANAKGVDVIVRFAHEMNGSFNPWGGKPDQFVEAWKRLEKWVGGCRPGTVLLWSPSVSYDGSKDEYGAGRVSKRGEKRGSVKCSNLIRPLSFSFPGLYWPGDDLVDLVGLSTYHFDDYTWKNTNDVAPPDKLVKELTGHLGYYKPMDFITRFVVGKRKPFVISETAAPWHEGAIATGTARDELQVKSSWWTQVYSPTLFAQIPGLMLIMWFECRKEEGGGMRDFRTVLGNGEVRDAFARHVCLPSVGMRFLD